jgi:cell division protein FtsB
VSDQDPLDRLSSAQLHDLAVRRALRHLDLGFFWDLLEVLPVAEAAAGELDEAVADIQRLSAHVDDLTDSGRGAIAEQLRPFYLDYLRRHGVRAP